MNVEKTIALALAVERLEGMVLAFDPNEPRDASGKWTDDESSARETINKWKKSEEYKKMVLFGQDVSAKEKELRKPWVDAIKTRYASEITDAIADGVVATQRNVSDNDLVVTKAGRLGLIVTGKVADTRVWSKGKGTTEKQIRWFDDGRQMSFYQLLDKDTPRKLSKPYTRPAESGVKPGTKQLVKAFKSRRLETGYEKDVLLKKLKEHKKGMGSAELRKSMKELFG